MLAYDVDTRQLVDAEVVLGGISNSRAAFELTKLCLLFLRIDWIANICRCRLRFGLLPEQQLYHFGLDMKTTAQHPPKWPHPMEHGNHIQGELEH